MSQISAENDDNCSVAAGDFVQLDQQDEVANQEIQQQKQPQFGFQQNLLDWTMNTGSTSNNFNDFKELKWMMAILQDKHQMVQETLANHQGKFENLELKAEIRSLKENAEQNANYQALEAKIMDQLKDEFAKMLSTQKEKHQKEMEQLEAKNRKLMEKLSYVELQTKGTPENAPIDGKMEQLKNEFSKMLAEQKKQMMAQFEAQISSLREENKLTFYDQMKPEILWSRFSNAKKLDNPTGNEWDESNMEIDKIIISPNGLVAKTYEWGGKVTAQQGFPISRENCRKDNFPDAILYYYEVTQTTLSQPKSGFAFGLSDGSIGKRRYYFLGSEPNSYCASSNFENYQLSGKTHDFEWPKRAIRPKCIAVGGCGLLLTMSPKNKLAIFFTANGILLGKQIPIAPSVDCLFPTIEISEVSMGANFGDDPAKRFKYDVEKCPGLVFE